MGADVVDLDAFRERSLRTWDSTAAGWEARHEFLERNVGHLNDWIIERISPEAGQAVLEVGAGPGGSGSPDRGSGRPGGSGDLDGLLVEDGGRRTTAR